MKNILLKVRILLTNISRIIMSFLFINLNFSSASKIFATDKSVVLSCYDRGPQYEAVKVENTVTLKNVLIILVPVAIIVGVVSLIIIKKRSKSKEKDNAKKD